MKLKYRIAIGVGIVATALFLAAGHDYRIAQRVREIDEELRAIENELTRSGAVIAPYRGSYIRRAERMGYLKREKEEREGQYLLHKDLWKPKDKKEEPKNEQRNKVDKRIV